MNRDCQHARELMDSYLGNELSVESNHAINRHLETCDRCRAELARRERTRALLVEGRGVAGDGSALRARITSAIDREQRLWSHLARYGTAAAIMLVIAGIGLWRTRSVDAAAYEDSADNHIVCALTVPLEATYDDRRIAKRLGPKYLGIVQALSRRYGGYELIDAHMCPYQQREYVHVVYRGEGGVISLFAEPAVRGRLPDTAQLATLQGTELELHSTAHKGYAINGATNGRYQLFVVHDQTAAPPSDVVSGILRSAASFFERLDE